MEKPSLLIVLSVVLTQFSVGTLLMTSLLPPREIRLGFFTLNALLGALTAALALVLTKFGAGAAWADVRFLGLTVILATVAYGSFKLEKLEIGRVLLVVSGLLGFTLGLLPLAARAREFHTTVPFIFDASVIAGALLLGATNVGMILGHWYLLMRKLSFEYLQRFGQLLLLAVGIRAVLVIVSVMVIRQFDPSLAATFLPDLFAADGKLMFFVIRLLAGIVGPLVLAFMILRCVEEQANQAATGLLYVAEISVLFGELFAAWLKI